MLARGILGMQVATNPQETVKERHEYLEGQTGNRDRPNSSLGFGSVPAAGSQT